MPGRDTFEVIGGVGKAWPYIEPIILEELAKKMVLDDIEVLKEIYQMIEIKKYRETESTATYTICFDYVRYKFEFEKRQSVWFLVEFRELEGPFKGK